MSSEPIVVLMTAANREEADQIAEMLVGARLAACVQILTEIESVYRWQGRIETEGEQLLLIKTVAERLDALQSALMARHPYEVPEFVVTRMDEVRGPWREWLIESVR